MLSLFLETWTYLPHPKNVQTYSDFFADDEVSTNVTDDRSHIPNAISDAPKYQDMGTNSPKKRIPYMA